MPAPAVVPSLSENTAKLEEFFSLGMSSHPDMEEKLQGLGISHVAGVWADVGKREK